VYFVALFTVTKEELRDALKVNVSFPKVTLLEGLECSSGFTSGFVECTTSDEARRLVDARSMVSYTLICANA
jgi:hypothetical protein